MDFKSYEYLEDIAKEYYLSKNELIDVLQNVSYFLQDNDYTDVSYFIDSVIDTIHE